MSGSGAGGPEAAGAAGAPGRGVAPTTSASKPVVMPETFDGTKSWEWEFHFDNVAAVNGWDDAQMLAWLTRPVRQKALQRLPDAARATYAATRATDAATRATDAATRATDAATRAALKARFDPTSRQTRYQAEFQTRHKQASEGWANFTDDLKSLVDKAYPPCEMRAVSNWQLMPISSKYCNHRLPSVSNRSVQLPLMMHLRPQLRWSHMSHE